MQSEEILENLPEREKSDQNRISGWSVALCMKKDGNRPIHQLLPSVQNSTFLKSQFEIFLKEKMTTKQGKWIRQ